MPSPLRRSESRPSHNVSYNMMMRRRSRRGSAAYRLDLRYAPIYDLPIEAGVGCALGPWLSGVTSRDEVCD